VNALYGPVDNEGKVDGECIRCFALKNEVGSVAKNILESQGIATKEVVEL